MVKRRRGDDISSEIYHLACPASPPHYQYNAVKTIKTSFMGTLNMLGLAKRTKARFLISSTSGMSPPLETVPESQFCFRRGLW